MRVKLNPRTYEDEASPMGGDPFEVHDPRQISEPVGGAASGNQFGTARWPLQMRFYGRAHSDRRLLGKPVKQHLLPATQSHKNTQ